MEILGFIIYFAWKLHKGLDQGAVVSIKSYIFGGFSAFSK